MNSIFIQLGAFCALTGVGLGAFGAHGLKGVITPEMLAVYQTGVNYQMWHSLGLIGVGLVQSQLPESKLTTWSGYLMFLGIVLFSGSLYVLALLDLHWAGMITPIGGVCFLLAWLLLCLSANKKKPSSRYQ